MSTPNTTPYPFLRWLTFVLLAALCSFAASYVPAPQQNDPAQLQRWQAHSAVRSFALASQGAKKPQAKQAQAWIDALRKSRELSLQKALVIAETGGGMFAFLRKKTFLAHSDAKERGKSLQKTNPAHKTLFDLSNAVQAKSKDSPTHVSFQSLPKGQLLAATAILSPQKKYLGIALLQLSAPTRAQAGSSGPLALRFSWLLAALLLGLLFFFLRNAWGHLFVLLGLGAVSLYPYVHQVEMHLQAQTQQVKTTQALLQQLLDQTPKAPKGWLKQVLPPKTATSFVRKSQAGKQRIVPVLTARPSLQQVPKMPFFGIGLAAILLYALMAWGFLQRASQVFVQHRLAYTYISPAMIGMIVLVFVPFLVGISLSFFRHKGGGVYEWAGLQNFLSILSDPLHPFPHSLNFYLTLCVTILWTALNVALHVSIGLGLAMLLKNPLLRMKAVYRVLLILPWAIPNYITALIWKGMFHQQFGSINALLVAFGLERVSWFSSFATAFSANLITNTWLGFPFMMVISLGALQSIPGDLYEAADVDGANRWQKFRFITLPLLKPALFPAIILGAIWTFNMFNIIYLVSGGEPGGATDILITEAYRWAFQRGDRYGYAAAYSTIIFLILLGYSLVTNRITKATEGI